MLGEGMSQGGPPLAWVQFFVIKISFKQPYNFSVLYYFLGDKQRVKCCGTLDPSITKVRYGTVDLDTTALSTKLEINGATPQCSTLGVVTLRGGMAIFLIVFKKGCIPWWL